MGFNKNQRHTPYNSTSGVLCLCSLLSETLQVAAFFKSEATEQRMDILNAAPFPTSSVSKKLKPQKVVLITFPTTI